MRIGLRIFLGYVLIVGLAGFFVMQVFVDEVKPGVRQAMEDTLVDTAHALAALAASDLAAGRIGEGGFARGLEPVTYVALVLERFEDNPFLPDFYRDPERYAFQTQIFFLLSRYRQQQEFRQLDLFYDYVVSVGDWVGRDQTADATGLERLVGEGGAEYPLGPGVRVPAAPLGRGIQPVR